MGLIALLAVGLVGYGILEYIRHQRRVNKIRIRVHVNGARGKSSVTRLIAAGLRAGGIRAYGKTTGTSPRVIDPQGLEIPIHRLRGASIGEQVKMFRYFARKNAEAVVIECMAIQPNYQWLSEHQMVHATLGVITNVRRDHTREMGPGIKQIARSLCNSLPANKKAFTSEQQLFPVMQQVARERNTDLTGVDLRNVTEAEMKEFNYVEHRDNVALALAVCAECGVDREVALSGMYSAHPDPGALKLVQTKSAGNTLVFVNGFAANDPDSTLQIWRQLGEQRSKAQSVTILLNSRVDRFPRTIQLVDMAAQYLDFDAMLLVGGRTSRARKHAIRKGIPAEKVIDLKEEPPEAVFRACVATGTNQILIFGIGNMGGGGAEIVEYFKYHQELTGEMII